MKKTFQDDKFAHLHKERYIRSIRIANDEHDGYYIKGHVWAEMRKNMSYNLDIHFNSFIVPKEAQCECSVGRGPHAHCKHVVLVIYALYQFASKNILITDTTCTQHLQTFHHTKEHKGTPMKCESLPAVRNQRDPNYDPRPLKYRQQDGAKDRIRNILVNYQASHPDRTMPISQMFPPANTYALYKDHDYLPLTMEQYFLKEDKLSDITDEDIIIIEERTKSQQKSKNWFEERLMRLTSSSFGSICQSTERCDKEKKAENLSSMNKLNNVYVRHGQKYESVAIEKFKRQTGLHVSESGLHVSKNYPYLGASPDGLLGDGETVIEVKCPYTAKNNVLTVQLCHLLWMEL